MNNAILLQHCLSTNAWTAPWSGIFYDQLRLTMPRHAAYCRAHGIDYQVTLGDVHPEQQKGAWGKIWLLLDAFHRGYEYAFWLDTDAAVMDLDCDLRDALPDAAAIGAVEHYAPWFDGLDIPRHYNVGVLYLRNVPEITTFLEEWATSYPGHQRWMEQGVFNDLVRGNRAKYVHLFAQVQDRWNATVNVNMVERPQVVGWHGVMPPQRRLDMMRSALRDDFMKFKV